MRSILLIDGAYLVKILTCKIDYRKLMAHFGCERAIYYDAVFEDRESTKRKFVDAIRYLAGVSVKLGKMESYKNHDSQCLHPESCSCPEVHTQKMVDVMLALDVVEAAQKFDRIVLIAADIDLLPAIQRKGLARIDLVVNSEVKKEMMMAVDQTINFNAGVQQQLALDNGGIGK